MNNYHIYISQKLVCFDTFINKRVFYQLTIQRSLTLLFPAQRGREGQNPAWGGGKCKIFVSDL